jgi:hypothetical protein
LFYGLGGALVIWAFAGLGLMKLGMDDSTRNMLFLSVPCVLGAVVFAIYRSRLFIREVAKSRERMRNPEYRTKLRELGFDVGECYRKHEQQIDVQVRAADSENKRPRVLTEQAKSTEEAHESGDSQLLIGGPSQKKTQ